jgi:RNA polymerase sigma-70 factor (ECF subfamily)
MLGNCPEAEDVGQETFIRFYNSLKNFRGESSVGTYLTRIAINLSLNELKRRKRRSYFFQKQGQESFDIPDEGSENAYDGQHDMIQNAIEKLEAKFRAVIVLRLIDGYSTEETAKMLKIPIGTVLSRLARAQQKLKKILSSTLGEIL